MLRDNIVTDHKGVIAHLKADSDLTTGTAVTIGTDGATFGKPTAATAENLYFLANARVDAALEGRALVSDWEPEFLKVAAGEAGLLYNYLAGDMFSTDQYDPSLTASDIGSYLESDTDGKLAKSASPTKYIVQAFTSEIGHAMLMVRVGETPVPAAPEAAE
jgi:hypothetical protein